MARILFIVNDPPYGTERAYNALRLAINVMKKDPSAELRMFLVGDAASCAKSGQKRSARLLQHRDHAEGSCAGRLHSWRMRHLHGRPRAQGRGSCRGRSTQLPQRDDRVDPMGGKSAGLLICSKNASGLRTAVEASVSGEQAKATMGSPSLVSFSANSNRQTS